MSESKRSMGPLAWVLGLSAAFFVVFLMFSGALYFYRAPGGGHAKSTSLFGGGSVGILEINGVIMDSKKTLERLDRFEESDEIKGVVVRINSPGGAVAPSQEIYEAIKRFKKPLVVSMGSVAASGGFYIACAAKKVFANAGTITGSIGVIMEFVNLSKLYDWAKVQRYSIKTGKFKDAGAEYREMTVEEKALLQGMVDNVLSQFKQAVVTGRKLTPAQVDLVADGRIFSGAQALERKLVDEIGTVDDAVRAVAGMAHIQGKPHLVYPDRGKLKWLEYFLTDSGDENSESRSPSGVAGLLRLFAGVTGEAVSSASPGIYWLWTAAH